MRLFFVILYVSYFVNLNAQNANAQILSLDSCISIAIKNHPRIKEVSFGLKIANEQKNQINSVDYPEFNLKLSGIALDESPNFVSPESQIIVPPIEIGGLIIQSDPINIPAQNVKALDKHTGLAVIDFKYPIWSGGYISALEKQINEAVNISKFQIIKEKVDIVAEVKTRFHTIYLLNNLLETVNDSKNLLTTTLKLAKELYQQGDNTVSRNDYLRNKMLVDYLETFIIDMESKLVLAKVALLNSMGVEYDLDFEIQNPSDEYVYKFNNYKEIYISVKKKNPLWEIANSSLAAFESKIEEARSEYFPKIGLFGSYNRLFNNYNYGMSTKENKNQWLIGVGLELSIFNGFRTEAKINEAKYKYLQLNEKINEFEKGLIALSQKAHIEVKSLELKTNKLYFMMAEAKENKEIIEKAYINDMVELPDLIESTIYESLIKSQYYTAKYNYELAKIELKKLLGEINEGM